MLGRLALALLGLTTIVGCSPPDLQSTPLTRQTSFGEKFFTIACQRVAYTSSLRAHQRDPAIPVDLAGQRYRLACRHGAAYLPDWAAQHDPKVAVFVGQRQRFIEAIDLIFPGDDLSGLQTYMGRILPLTDNDALPDLVRRLAWQLRDMSTDPELTRALAHFDRRFGYRPRTVAIGAVREALNYPRLKNLLDSVLAMVGPDGPAHDPLVTLAAGLGLELQDAQPTTSAERPLKLALDLLFETDPVFGSGSPHWIVQRDLRGLALVRRDPQTGTLPAPFVDADGDGLADTDGAGQLRAVDGQPPAPFLIDDTALDQASGRDAFGRALDARGQPLFEYRDLDDTLLAGLSREMIHLVDPAQNTLFDLVRGAGGLLGPRQQTARSNAAGTLTYDGIDPHKSPVLDLAYAGLQLARAPQIDDLLTLVRTMLTDSSLTGLTARLGGAVLAARDLADQHPEAVVDPQANLYDELAVVLRKIVNKPGLIEDLAVALGDPRTRHLGSVFAALLSHRDVHGFNGNGPVVSAQGCGSMWCQKVDRSRPAVDGNRSIMQRLLHLFHNSNGMKLCNKAGAKIKLPVIGIPVSGSFGECELFEVENGALFYSQAMANERTASGQLTGTPKARLRLKTENMPGWMATIVNEIGPDKVLPLLSGIDGLTTRPTPQAISRLLFDKMSTALAGVMDPTVDIDGHPVASYHRGTLASWEVNVPGVSDCSANAPCNFFGAFQPIVQAFADHDAEQLLIDLLAGIHRHWAAARSEDTASVGTGVVTYEPLLVDLLRSDLLPAVRQAMPVITALKLPGGQRAIDVVEDFARWVIDPSQTPGLTYRDGRAVAYSTDGSYTIEGGVSPYYLIADAWTAAKRSLEQAGPGIDQAWRRATSQLLDLMLGVEGSGTSTRFRNQRFVVAARHLIDFVQRRIAAHRARGDLVSWVSSELPADLTRSFSGPVLPAAADMVDQLAHNPQALYELNQLCRYLFDELQNPQSFAATLTALADLLQLGLADADLVPLLRGLGRALSADSGLIKAALRFLQPAIAADAESNLLKVLRNAYQEQAPGRSPLQTLLEVATDLHREQPGATTPYTGPDFAAALEQIADFLSNSQTGLESFFNIVKNRCIGGCVGGGG